MATFPFTVRAIDSENAFSDRQFSINVRNTRVERYLVIDATNAWTSNDLVNWTIRLGQGGTHCAYGNGMWMVIGGGGVRTSADGINWSFTPQANLVVTRPNGDAATWVSPTNTFDSGISTSLNFAGGRFWFSRAETNVGHELFSSADGINWRRQIVIASGSWNLTSQYIGYSKRSVVDVGGGTLLYNNNTTLASVAALNLIGYISTDNGVTWTGLRRNDLATNVSQASSYLTRFNGVYYAFSTQPQTPGGSPYVGTAMTYSYSTDGSNWINSTLNSGNSTALAEFNRHPTTVCHYVNGQLVVLGGRTGSTNSGTIGHIQTRSVNGTGWTVDTNVIKNMNLNSLNTLGANGSWQYRNGVLLGTLSIISGTDTTQTVNIGGPGVRYSVDGGLTWVASFPLTAGGTTNTSGYNDVAIMG